MKIGKATVHTNARRELRKSLATLVGHLNSNVTLSDAERETRRMEATSELTYADIPYGYDKAFESFRFFPDVGRVDLYDDERKALWVLINLIQEAFPETFSWDYIRNVITGPDSLIERLVASGGLKEEQIDRELDALLARLVSSVAEWVVSIPIVNLRIEVGPVFHEGGDEWCLPIGKVSIYAIKDMPEFNLDLFSELRGEYLESAQYAARTKVEAGDSWQAVKKALIETQDALNIIRLFLSSAIRTDHSKMNIVGTGKSGMQLLAVRKADSPEGDQLSYSHHWKALGVGSETFIHGAAFQYMKDNGFKEIGQIFSTENPSRLQQRIIRAIRWFAQGTDSDSKVDAFIKCIVALEILLGQEAKDPHIPTAGITARLAERTAFLLGVNVDRDQRKQIAKDITRLHRKRGKLVHGSSSDVNVQELSLLETYVRRVIFVFAKQEDYTAYQGFVDWVENQKFSVGEVESLDHESAKGFRAFRGFSLG
jgi:hypothetical protein